MPKSTDDRMFRVKFHSLKTVGTVLGWGASAAFLAVVFLILSGVLASFKDADRYPVSKRMLYYAAVVEVPARTFLKATIPTEVDGRDLWRQILLVALFLASSAFSRAGKSVRDGAWRLWDDKAEEDQNAAVILDQVGKLRKGKLSRAELLELMAQTQKSLEKHRQHLAFLSIDLADAVGMKVGEDPVAVNKDFGAYKALVDDIARENRFFKMAWTHDGVMICFLETSQAVRTAQQVIRELGSFNKETRTIKHEFAVRAGINAGSLLTEDSIPMEAMADRVIDIAGHMQKHGAENAVSISEHAIAPLKTQFAFSPAGRVVDGCPVYEWRLPAEEPAAVGEPGEPGVPMEDAVPA